MHTRRVSLRLLLAGSAIFATFGTGAFAADVTPDRLVNADKEPGNWLMNHRIYDAQRSPPFDRIKRAPVKGLRPPFAVAIGGPPRNETLQPPPPAEDGFLYVFAQ